MSQLDLDFVDYLGFYLCPLLLTGTLVILLRRRAHWTLGFGVSLLVALGTRIV